MNRRFKLKMHDYIHSPAGKRTYNERMFAEIAPHYDLVNKILSLGRDCVWKDTLVRSLPDIQSPTCLDLACGTGDITFRLAKRYPAANVTGIDITEPMLALANSRNCHANVTFLDKDMCATGVADSSIDIVTGAYALRNAPDLQAALKEIHRVLKPGGIAAFLDFSKPPSRPLQKVENALLKTWCGFWGILLAGNYEVYAYVAESLKQFPNAEQLKLLLKDTGFEQIHSRNYYFGVLAAVSCRKPPPPNI